MGEGDRLRAYLKQQRETAPRTERRGEVKAGGLVWQVRPATTRLTMQEAGRLAQVTLTPQQEAIRIRRHIGRLATYRIEELAAAQPAEMAQHIERLTEAVNGLVADLEASASVEAAIERSSQAHIREDNQTLVVSCVIGVKEEGAGKFIPCTVFANRLLAKRQGAGLAKRGVEAIAFDQWDAATVWAVVAAKIREISGGEEDQRLLDAFLRGAPDGEAEVLPDRPAAGDATA